MDISVLLRQIRKQVQGEWYGQRQSRRSWEWYEKIDARPYAPWDSAKRIDRKASAKLQWTTSHELMTFQLLEETDVHIDVFCDINPNWSTWHDRLIWLQIQDILSTCQLFAIRYRLPLQITYNHRWIIKPLHQLANSQSRTHSQQIDISHILDTSKTYTSSLEQYVIQALQKPQKRIIFLFSDFLSRNTTIKKKLTALSVIHSVFAWHIRISEMWWFNYDAYSLKPKSVSFPCTSFIIW